MAIVQIDEGFEDSSLWSELKRCIKRGHKEDIAHVWKALDGAGLAI